MILSIVIPIFNVERYINGCLDSIFCKNEVTSDVEIIVVNDGTQDNSMKIVREFSKLHKITILEQKNQGLSGARNTGLFNSHGKYIWFFDSDDQMVPGILQSLLSLLYKSDIDIHSFCLKLKNELSGNIDSQSTIIKSKYSYLINKKITRSDIPHKVHCAPAQRFIFKRSFLNRNGLCFKGGIIHEDVEFMCRAYFFAKSVFLHDFQIYQYLQRANGSIMSSLDFKTITSRDAIIDSLHTFKSMHAFSVADKYFIDEYIAKVLMGLYSLKIKDKSDYILFLDKNRIKYKHFALSGIKANLYYKDFIKTIKCLVLFLSPTSYRLLFS